MTGAAQARSNSNPYKTFSVKDRRLVASKNIRLHQQWIREKLAEKSLERLIILNISLDIIYLNIFIEEAIGM